MSGGRSFIIQELVPSGSNPGDTGGERFEWTAESARSFSLVSKGGGKAIPRAPWSLGISVHSVRTDYPNATIPTEQIAGPRRKPFTLTGRWQDKYNFPGYAEAELERFENMVSRARRCRFQYGNQSVEGLITEFDPEYRRPWDISYSFTVSVHNRQGATGRSRIPATTETPARSFNDVDLAVRAMLDAHASAPRSAMGGSLAVDMDEALSNLADDREVLASTIDNRSTIPIATAVDGFTRIASQFRAVRGSAFDVLVQLAAVRSDLDVSTQTVIGVLGFEVWSRQLRYGARLALHTARIGDRDASSRAAPDAIRLYRPRAGESPYAISRKFYGTPHAWGLIAQRNGLTSAIFTGAETLIIPDRGAA